MATREENIKKINEELEKLDDEELEKVAGGSYKWRPLFVIDEDNQNTDMKPLGIKKWKRS